MAERRYNPRVTVPFTRFTDAIPDGQEVSIGNLELPASGPCALFDWSSVAVIVNTHAAHPAGNYVEATRFSNSCFCPTVIATSEGDDSTWMIADHCGLYGSGGEFGGDQVRLRAPDGTDVELDVDNVYAVGAIHLIQTETIPAAFPRHKLVTNIDDLGGCGFWTCKHDGTGQFYYLWPTQSGATLGAIDSDFGVPNSPITTEMMSSSGRPCFIPLADGTMALLGTQGPSNSTIRWYNPGSADAYAASVEIAALEAVMGSETILTVEVDPGPAYSPPLPMCLRRHGFSMGMSL